MAKKPGAWDLRCNEAVLSAMLVHPRYGQDCRFVESGKQIVRMGNWAFAAYLPRDAAHDALMASAEMIAKKQQRCGLWFRKNGECLSFAILRALAHGKVLQPFLAGRQLRFDPFQTFIDSQDYYGLLVREDILQRPLPGDGKLRRHLQDEDFKAQQPDGSWGRTVSTTALYIERLLELRVESTHRRIKKAVGWMMGQFRAVERRRPSAAWSIHVAHMVTTDSNEEFRLAQHMLPQANLAGACFVCLPILPTAFALRVLSRLGLHNDERVELAYRTLLDMEIKDGEEAFGRTLHSGWCGHQCRFKLEARLRDRLSKS